MSLTKKRRRLGAGLVASLAVAFLVLSQPVPAQADPPPLLPIFKLKASNGYSIIGIVSSADGDEGTEREGREYLYLYVFGERGGAVYRVPGRFSEATGDLSAELGSLGVVDLHFAALPGRFRKRSRCDGEALDVRRGRFEGTFNFNGEEGYTQVSAAGARAYPEFLLDVLCPGAAGGWSSGGIGAELQAVRGAGKTRVSVEAAKRSPGKPTHLSARIAEGRPGLRVERFVRTVAPSGAFAYRPKSESARLVPPPPFSGTASYLPGSPMDERWRGDLAVDFPGRSGVPLTGPGFEARFRHLTFSGGIFR